MGTETILTAVISVCNYQRPVKLNNPQMGTETVSTFFLVVFLGSFSG